MGPGSAPLRGLAGMTAERWQTVLIASPPFAGRAPPRALSSFSSVRTKLRNTLSVGRRRGSAAARGTRLSPIRFVFIGPPRNGGG